MGSEVLGKLSRSSTLLWLQLCQVPTEHSMEYLGKLYRYMMKATSNDRPHILLPAKVLDVVSTLLRKVTQLYMNKHGCSVSFRTQWTYLDVNKAKKLFIAR